MIRVQGEDEKIERERQKEEGQTRWHNIYWKRIIVLPFMQFSLFLFPSLSLSCTHTHTHTRLPLTFLNLLLPAFSSLDKPQELKLRRDQEEDNGPGRSAVYLPVVVGTWIDRMKSRFIVWLERSRRVRTHGCHVVHSPDKRLLPPQQRINDYALPSCPYI